MAKVNPIERLLDALPAAVAREKRAIIKADLEGIGMWNHYDQTIRKQGKDLNGIIIRAAGVFVNHLGLSYEFFNKEQKSQEEEVDRIIGKHYKKLVPVN
jgi:hypothetical protein